MKPTLTEDDRTRLDGVLREAHYHWKQAASLELVIIGMLGLKEDQADGIVTDAIGAGWTLDQLLQALEEIPG